MPTKEASPTAKLFVNRFVLCIPAGGGRPLSAEADRGDGDHAEKQVSQTQILNPSNSRGLKIIACFRKYPTLSKVFT